MNIVGRIPGGVGWESWKKNTHLLEEVTLSMILMAFRDVPQLYFAILTGLWITEIC